MRKLQAVEDARAIMTQGIEWSVWKWLAEKRRVRAIADKAVEALDDCEAKVKDSWSDDLKIAYNDLVARDDGPRRKRKQANGGSRSTTTIDPAVKQAIAKVKEADDIAWDARWAAEDLFADAETRMNPGLAREGARKALESYDLHEAAIRKAEAVAKVKY